MQRTQDRGVAAAALGLKEADHRLLQDPRFALADDIVAGRPIRRWRDGIATINDLLTLYADRSDREFLVYENERCTYGAALRAINLLCGDLFAAGVRAGDRVALLMRNRLEWPICFFATIRAGAVAVPINGWALPADVEETLRDCGARALLTDRPDLAGEACNFGDRIWTIAKPPGGRRLETLIGSPGTWAALPVGNHPGHPNAPSDLAAIFYTSGTTSKPKGVPITHRAITTGIKNAEFAAERARLRFPPPDGAGAAPAPPVVLLPIPFFHVSGAIAGLIGLSAAGARIVLMRKWDVQAAMRLVARERITLIGGVPTMPLELLAHPDRHDHDLSSLTGLLFGGAPAPAFLPAAILHDLGAQAATGWGMTETASTLLHNSGADFRLRPASCGAPVPVNEVRIVDAADVPVPPNISGALQVRGVNVTAGYWNHPHASMTAFTRDGWFRTGDVAQRDGEGFVTIVGRSKDILIRGGENIACPEIELLLCEHPDILEAAVVGQPHPTLGEEPVAFVTIRGSAALTEGDARLFAAGRLPAYKVPVRILVSHDPLPKNPAGKVVKADLQQSLGQHG